MSTVSSEVEYDALVLVLPAHVIVYVRDLIEDAETVNEAVQSVRRYIEDEIAAAEASGAWYAYAWKYFADAMELLLRTYGNYFVVPEWLGEYIRYLLSYSPTSRINHFVAIVGNIRDEVVMQMGVTVDDSGNPRALVTIERPLCSALQQLITAIDGWKYVLLFNRAIFYTTGDETRHFIYDVMRSVGCIKPITKLSEFMP